MRDGDENLKRWLEVYRRRAALDPLRAVIDERDPDNVKNEWVDRVQRRQISRLLSRRRYGVAADLGCGVGRLTPLLAARARRVVGVDASVDLLAAARRRLGAGGPGFAVGDFRALPLPTAGVDLAFTCDALLHLVDDDGFAATAAEVARVLCPGGEALLVEHVSAGAETERRQGVVFRTPDDLLRPFRAAGLEVARHRPVRKVPSRLVHWARRGRLPRPLWPLAIRFEPFLATRGREPPDYREDAFLLRAPGERGVS